MELFKSTRHLGSFPQSCRVFQETEDGPVRELLHRGYRIFYQEYGGAIEILHLRHGSRRVGSDRPATRNRIGENGLTVTISPCIWHWDLPDEYRHKSVGE